MRIKKICKLCIDIGMLAIMVLLFDFLIVMISGIMYAADLHRVTAILFLILTILHILAHGKKASAKHRN